jgi:hypothetical protein
MLNPAIPKIDQDRDVGAESDVLAAQLQLRLGPKGGVIGNIAIRKIAIF